MDNNMMNAEKTNTYMQPENGTDFDMIKKKTAQAYNRTGGAMTLDFVIALLVQIIVTTIVQVGYMAQGHSVEETVEYTTTNGMFLVGATAISYFIAHIAAYFIGLGMTHRLKGAGRLFAKPQFSGKIMLFAAAAALGCQFLNIVLQQLTTWITGSSGVENMNMEMLSYGDNMTHNIILFLYIVIIAPVLEEIIFRGMALRNMTAVNKSFGIIMTAVMFGLFHGNILQFFTGLTLGLLFAYVDIKTGSILPSIILHIINNGLAFILMVVQYYITDEQSITTISIAYMAVLFIIGVIGFILLMKNTKDVTDAENSAYSPIFDVNAEEKKQLSVKPVLKSPCIWIFAIIYIILIIYNI